jgi:hypothetical protein
MRITVAPTYACRDPLSSPLTPIFRALRAQIASSLRRTRTARADDEKGAARMYRR